jgi:FKBP-type peptidyl-prolyl cis-trans isomerase SlpA
MRTSQVGDRVRVHFVQNFEDGSVRSSRDGAGEALELTVGTDHRRLPGLSLELVGLAEGQVVTLDIPAERAYGLTTPDRIKRVARSRFAADEDVAPGRRARMKLTRGRRRTVRVVEVSESAVIVDLNHPRSGQSVHLEVELVSILGAAPEVECRR